MREPVPQDFGPDFLWGTSTAAYQIEGAVSEDGREPSIWDVFCQQPGKILNADTGAVACDHYHLYREDIALMKQLGQDVYRFSVAWPRIFPTGRGKLNNAGMDFYQRLVDELVANKIEPWLCFYHWDLPQALQEMGGWTNRDTAGWYTDYAIAVADKLGDRVGHFVMLNEPMVCSYLGHFLGVHAPGMESKEAFLAATHHLNLAAGQGLTALRTQGGDWQLGTVVNMGLAPQIEGADPEAGKLHDEILFWPFLDPLLLGCYPESLDPLIARYVRTGDLQLIQHPVDFIGVNYYFPERVIKDSKSPFGFREVPPPDKVPKTAMGWEIRPASFTDTLLAIKNRYPKTPPIYISENGAAFVDTVESDGAINDRERTEYIQGHIAAVAEARNAGVDVRGYFVWSLLDNFEWAYGYDRRFGLAHVDYATQRRTPKASFRWYQQFIRAAKAS
ncbi:MAG: beta-glucosidase [Verrucomicrobia bacterium]|nr:beta-glucosidase [Verrucomicrobiota bacterium]